MDRRSLRRHALGLVLGGSAAVVWVAPAEVLAGDPTAVDDAVDVDPEIYLGTPVGECGWPTVVAVSGGGLCSGTLIHPQLIVYAAHCGGGTKSIRFNSQNNNSGFTRTGTCTTNPNYGGVVARDWAFCVLDSPVNMPVTPGRSLVASSASRTASGSSELARMIASEISSSAS